METSNLDRDLHYPDGPSASDKSVVELSGDLARQMSTLVHHEIELAKIEMAEKGKRAGLGAGMFGGAGILAGFGVACLTACVIAALHLALSVWLSTLIVGAGYMVIAGTFAMAGRRQIRQATPTVPTDALESSKEDVEWLKKQAKSARR